MARGRLWTTEETDRLRLLTEQGYDSVHIGFKLGRSAISVRLQRMRAGIVWQRRRT